MSVTSITSTRPVASAKGDSLIKRTATLASALLIAGCAGGSATPGTHAISPTPSISSRSAEVDSVMATGDDLLPSSDATSWVTYADYLVQVMIVRETRIPATKEEQNAGEGLIGREVIVRPEVTLWSRPSTDAPRPKDMTWSAGGWKFNEKSELPIVFPGVPSLLPGHRYLVPITYTPFSLDGAGQPVWIPLSGTAMLPFDEGIVGKGEQIKTTTGIYNGNSAGETPLRDSIWGRSGEAVASILNQTRPDPAATAYMSENPVVRYKKVLQFKNGEDSNKPGPGES